MSIVTCVRRCDMSLFLLNLFVIYDLENVDGVLDSTLVLHDDGLLSEIENHPSRLLSWEFSSHL